jgi:hypothetical protein
MSPRERRAAIGGTVVAIVATASAYANGGVWAALLTAGVCLAAVAFVLTLARLANR